MAFLRFLRYLSGSVKISVTGRNVERFINICMRRGILLWDIKRVRTNCSEMKISVEGFRSLREVSRKSGCSVRIIGKYGVPFSKSKRRKHIGLLVGMLIFALVIFLTTSFVWDVEVVGNDRVPTESVLESLKECGISVGRWRYGKDLTAIQNKVLLLQPELSWLALNPKGSKMVVSVAEKIPAPKITDRTSPANLVASKDGMVETVIATNGVAVVKSGDTVKKGDLLISGVDNSQTNGVRYLHAMGSVRAKTWDVFNQKVLNEKTTLQKTGRQKKHYSLKILNFEINFFKKGSIPYAEYDTINEAKEFRLSERFYLPLSLSIQTYEELTAVTVSQSLEEAKDAAIDALEQKQGDYLFRRVNWEPVNESEGVLTVIYEKIEEIAELQTIPQGGT